MPITDYENPDIFEDEVRRIARGLWPQAEYDGAAKVDGKERDGIFNTEECIHLIEATANKEKSKAEKDAYKLINLAQNLIKNPDHKPVKCWLITRHEPTAEQRAIVNELSGKNHQIVHILSFSQFQSKLINVHTYLSARDSYKFGSIHNPIDFSNDPNIPYVDIDLLDSDKNLWSIRKICDELENGGRILLLGDYGAGKSMTLREIYREIRKKYLKGNTPKFSIYINLRDHQGAEQPDEILTRHARKIGYDQPSHLIRAWNAGYAHIILDGFDEITSLGIQGNWRKLRDVRYKSMQAIRRFIDNTPSDTGLILAGRSYYFDSEQERLESLCSNKSFTSLTLNDFSDDQIKSFIDKNKVTGLVPKWLPSRPLLIGTLLLKGLLHTNSHTSDGNESVYSDPGSGWDTLINDIAIRESKIEAGIDSETIRCIIERLSTRARQTPSGLGPLTEKDILSVFEEVCQYSPDNQAMILIQRLPGLGIDSASEGSRKFIDDHFADACRAGDLYRAIIDPYNSNLSHLFDISIPVDSVGHAVTTHKLITQKITEKQFNASLQHLCKNDGLECIKFDLINIAQDLNFNIYENTQISNVHAKSLSLENDSDFSKISVTDSYFNRLSFYTNNIEKMPSFYTCYFSIINGATENDTSKINNFRDCIFENFEMNVDTTDDIMNLSLAIEVKVALTILKKIYLQRGTGRNESALFRGLDANSKRYVNDALTILKSEGLITPYQRQGTRIWLPIRGQSVRVSRLITSPTSSNDSVLNRLSN